MEVREPIVFPTGKVSQGSPSPLGELPWTLSADISFEGPAAVDKEGLGLQLEQVQEGVSAFLPHFLSISSANVKSSFSLPLTLHLPFFLSPLYVSLSLSLSLSFLLSLALSVILYLLFNS